VWHDLMTTDGAAAHAFYAALFDWQIDARDMQGCVYRMIRCGPGPIGGIVEEKKIPMSHWMPYVAVADVDAAAKRVAELGGSVCVPPTDIPMTGRFAVVGDPCGAFFSLYKGLPEAQGADPDAPVPGRVCWNEVYATDDSKAQAFYSKLFGWQPETKDMGEAGLYRVQMLGGKQAGGLIEDLTAATKKGKQLGAATMMESVPIPEVGAFSMLTDPTGAMFALFQPNMTGKPC
jgi:predicted enzyme related to lactoylglutathione lyase